MLSEVNVERVLFILWSLIARGEGKCLMSAVTKRVKIFIFVADFKHSNNFLRFVCKGSISLSFSYHFSSLLLTL